VNTPVRYPLRTTHKETSAQSPARVHRSDLYAGRQGGVVLVIALIMLVLISLLVVTSIRNAISTESVIGNVRTTELATQAAEIALRHCESSVLALMETAAGGTSTYATTLTSAHIQSPVTPPHWQNKATWDSDSSAVFVLPLSLVNQSGMSITTYQRSPECMVEPLPVLPSGAKDLNTTSVFVVTARGFGPEVAALNGSHSRPVGSEIWLQSHIHLQ
jgi:Tfp pilus assembly protein PilX